MKTEGVRILLFDLENSPIRGHAWEIYDTNVFVEEDWYMLSWSAKWFGERETMVKGLCDYKGYKKGSQDDSKLVKELWELLNKADIVIAHNGDRFDIRKFNARCLIHGLTPPRPYKTVDTLKTARRYFKMTSNKLDDLGRSLGVGRKKVTTGFDLWKRVMLGESKAWKEMKEYNKQDVILLEKVYKKLLPWTKNHPSVNLFTRENKACPNCGSKHLSKNGYRGTASGIRQRYLCVGCGNSAILGPTDKATKIEYKNE